MSEERRHPLRDLFYLQDRIDRVFDETLKDSRVYKTPGQWVPYVDIFEDDDMLTIKVELPGVRKDDIILDIGRGLLTISGEKRFSHDKQSENYHMIERQFGYFKRSFNMPDFVDIEKVDAKFRTGILMVTLPKLNGSDARRILITKD